jgi:hypothetical protein
MKKLELVHPKRSHAMGLAPGALDPLSAAQIMGARGGSKRSDAQTAQRERALKRGGSTGRPKLARYCQVCGEKCGSWKQAQDHCRKVNKKRKD